MTIGRFEPQESRPESMKDCVRILVDEALTALEESFHDLTDEQAWACPLPGRHNIATLVLHMQHNVDLHACWLQTGQSVLKHEERFDIWRHPAPGDPRRKTDLPTVAWLRERQQSLRAAVLQALEQASEADMLGPRAAEGQYWWQEHKRTSLSAYMRIVCHTHAHVRQIWLLRGVLGATDAKGWPQQHYH